MTQRKALLGTTAVLVALAQTAYADVTARQVWDNMSGFYSTAGYDVLAGSVDESGGTVTVSDLRINFPNPYADLQEEIAIDMFAVLPNITLEDNGDGTVKITSSETYTLNVTIEPEGEESGSFGILVDQAGTLMTRRAIPTK